MKHLDNNINWEKYGLSGDEPPTNAASERTRLKESSTSEGASFYGREDADELFSNEKVKTKQYYSYLLNTVHTVLSILG